MKAPQAYRTSSASLWARAAVGAGLALVANLAVWAIAAAGGIDVRIPERPGSEAYAALSVMPVVMITVMSALAATLGLAVLRRIAPTRALQTFVIVAAVLAVLSLGAVFVLDVSTGAKIALSTMHLVTAAAIILAQSWGVAPAADRVSPSTSAASR